MSGDSSDDVTVGKPVHRGWLSAEINGPSLLALLALLVVGGLGGASIGGGFGLAVTLIVLAAMVALLVIWSGAPDPTPETGKRSLSAAESDD